MFQQLFKIPNFQMKLKFYFMKKFESKISANEKIKIIASFVSLGMVGYCLFRTKVQKGELSEKFSYQRITKPPGHK